MQLTVGNVSALQNSSIYTCCPNSLASRLTITTAQSYTVAGAISFLILPTLLANGLLLFVQMRKIKSSYQMNTVITSINGCLFSVSGLPMYIALFTQYRQQRNCLLENTSIFVVQVETHVLGYTILVLAIDRYFFVRPNFGWSKSVSLWMQTRVGLAITTSAILILSLLHGTVSINFFEGLKSTIAKVAMMLLNAIIVLVVYVAYLKLYCEIRVHEISFSNSQEQNARSQGRDRDGGGYMREFIKTVSILLIAGIICYLPFLVMDCWTGWYTFGLKTESPQNVRFCYYLSLVPVFLYSSINASLLLYRSDEVWKVIRRMFRSMNRLRATVISSESS